MLTERQVIEGQSNLDCRTIAEAFDNPRFWLLSPSLSYLEEASAKNGCDFSAYVVSSDPEIKGLALALTHVRGLERESIRLLESEKDSPGAIGALRYIARFEDAQRYALRLLESHNLRVVQEALLYLNVEDKETLAEAIDLIEPLVFNLRDDFVIESVLELMKRAKCMNVLTCERLFEKFASALEGESQTAVKAFAELYDPCLSPLIPLFVEAVERTESYAEAIKLASKGITAIAVWLPRILERMPKLTSYEIDVVVNYATSSDVPLTMREAIVLALIKRIVEEKVYHLMSLEALMKLKSFPTQFARLASLAEKDSREFWNAALLRSVIGKMRGEDVREYVTLFERLFQGEKPEWLRKTIQYVMA
ncbi:MAG: hypothetical protein ACP5HQ_03810 [Thermoprotei archaeon]